MIDQPLPVRRRFADLGLWPTDWRRRVPELRDLGIHYGLRALPTERCSDLGARLGLAIGRRAYPAADARARALFARIRPDLATPATAEPALTRLWQNIGRTFAEFSVLHRLVPQGRVELSDPALLDMVYAGDRPLIQCFVHLGNWEALGMRLAAHPRIHRGRPIAAVVMPPGNRAHAFIAAHQRRALPVDLLPMDRHIWRTMGECLRRPGGIAWIAADEVADGRVGAPHFGRPIRTGGNLGKVVRLAAATGARIMPVYCERLEGARFRVNILPLVEVPPGRLDRDALAAEVARLDAVFAPIVARLIDQWYMAIEFRFATDPVL